MARVASSSTSPIATTRWSRMPTSARWAGAPVPSTTVPPVSLRSSMSDLRTLQFGGNWMTEQVRRVLPCDLAHFGRREVAQAVDRTQLGVGPGGVGVRVVALEADVVDADVFAQRHRRRDVDRAEPEVAAQRVGGREAGVVP